MQSWLFSEFLLTRKSVTCINYLKTRTLESNGKVRRGKTHTTIFRRNDAVPMAEVSWWLLVYKLTRLRVAHVAGVRASSGEQSVIGGMNTLTFSSTAYIFSGLTGTSHSFRAPSIPYAQIQRRGIWKAGSMSHGGIAQYQMLCSEPQEMQSRKPIN
jgi:hypothetical protein